jgi:hypothetical protein
MPSPRIPERPPVDRISSILEGAEPYHKPAVIWQSRTKYDIRLTRGSLTIICGGSHQEVIGQSFKLAQEICRRNVREKSPWPYNPEEVSDGQRVFYLNTATTRERMTNEAVGLWPGAQEWCVKRDRFMRPNPGKDDKLHLYHVPSGQFNEHFPEIKIQHRQNMASVVILNSFEFACRTARHRDDLVFQLLALREAGCAVIVFTQEEKRKVVKQARGPLALLRMQADAVLDHTIFERLVYAGAVGSTHSSEEEYYESTGECGPEYFKRLREQSSSETVESEVGLPDRVTSAEIKDTVNDDIELPGELVDGGVYTLDGKLVCVNEVASLQTLNTYRVHTNSFEPQLK